MRPAHSTFAALLAMAITVTQVAAQPTPPRATITRDLRLDANDEDFPRVGYLYVGPRGQIAIPIYPDMNVRVYDSTGKKIAVIGRKGSGPGEFQDMNPLGWKGDTMWVNDHSQLRITYIDPDHKVLRTVLDERFDSGLSEAERKKATAMMNGMPITSSVSIAGMHADGTIVGYGYRLRQGDSPAERAFGAPTPIVRVGRDRKQVTIATLPWGGDPRWGMAAGGYGNYIPFMMPPQTAFSSSGDRVAHMWAETKSSGGGTFTVSAFRANGDTMFVRTFPFAGVPIPAHVKDSALAALGRATGEGGAALRAQFLEIAKQKMPPVYSAAAQLLIGLDGTFWVGMRRTSEGQSFLVLNARGNPVATLAIAANQRLRQASATKIYVTETDADGLVSVARYRVSGIDCGSPGCR